jgi:hypothetical protein
MTELGQFRTQIVYIGVWVHRARFRTAWREKGREYLVRVLADEEPNEDLAKGSVARPASPQLKRRLESSARRRRLQPCASLRPRPQPRATRRPSPSQAAAHQSRRRSWWESGRAGGREYTLAKVSWIEREARERDERKRSRMNPRLSELEEWRLPARYISLAGWPYILVFLTIFFRNTVWIPYELLFFNYLYILRLNFSI